METSQENSKKVCYCGKERNLSIVEVACSNCQRFFHESCIGYQFGKILSFSMNYVFTCKLCSVTGLESYRRTSATIPQMCITTLANLQRKSERDGSPKYLFNKDEIISFVDMYWESITTIARKQTNSWHFNIIKTLQAHQNLFISQEDMDETLYGLVDVDLTTIKPQYETAKVGHKDEGKVLKWQLLVKNTPLGKKDKLFEFRLYKSLGGSLICAIINNNLILNRQSFKIID